MTEDRYVEVMKTRPPEHYNGSEDQIRECFRNYLKRGARCLMPEEIEIIENSTGKILTGIRDTGDGAWEALGVGDVVIWKGASLTDDGWAVVA